MELSVDDLRQKRLEFFTKFNKHRESKPMSAYEKLPTTPMSVSTNNKKLDEFKKIVESVNNYHSNNTNSKSSRRSSNSTSTSTNATEQISNRSIDINNNDLSNVSCKIQFMSAYNIYEPAVQVAVLPSPPPQPPQQQSASNRVEETHTYRKMSMSPRVRLRLYQNSDDSLSPSSSSPSSTAPPPKQNQFEIRPPSTQPSNTTSFRRNFTRKLSFEAKTSVETQKQQLEISKLNSKKSENHEEQSDNENTLDDNLSDIDVPNQSFQERPEVRLDLAGLSDNDDEEVKVKVEQKLTDDRSLTLSECDYYHSSDTYRQVKPAFIPNLVLNDEEDRSISVAASLAKSMCNEIDYKQEMESLFQKSDDTNKLPIKLHKEAKPLVGSSRRNGSIVNNKQTKLTQITTNQNDSMSVVNTSNPFFLFTNEMLSRPNTLQTQFESTIGDHISAKWESANVNSKSNVKLNLFAANHHRTFDAIISKRPKTTASVMQAKSTPTENQVQSIDMTGSCLFLNYTKLHQIDNQIFIEDTLRDEPTMEELKTATSSQPNWTSLPHELWLKIIRKVSINDRLSFGRTCKSFHQIFNDLTLWKSIKIKNCNNINDTTLEWIASKQPSELSLIQCDGNVTLNQISEMFKALGKHLHVLNLSSCFNGQLSSENMALQASVRCPYIRSIDLSWTLLSNDSLKLVADSYECLREINLSGCNMIRDDGLDYFLLKHGQKLQVLELAGCFHLPSSCILNIGVYCSELKRLNLSNCHRVTNQTLLESCINWLNLRFLDLRGLKDVRNNCISQIVRKCVSLEGIALANCLHISDLSISEIATYKANIKYLDFKGCKKITDNGLRSLTKTCFHVEYLDLASTSITNEGIDIVSNSTIAQSIQEINLSFLSVSESCAIKLVSNCYKLKKLHLHCCYNIKKFDDIRSATVSKDLVFDY